MLKRVSKIYENMSLFKKLIIIYIIVIAIPIVYFSVYSYNKMLNSIERDYINEARESAASIKSALLYKINTTEDIMERLSMDPQLNRLLSSKYILMSELLESYKYQIIPQLKNTIIFNKANICRISIYTNNANLTESWDYFYKLSRISNSKWYNDFIKSS
ncbi:hypothetical protein [Mahella australiensis]|uniref:Uncharacterized protein n=1 Tax=Mahella australiensis (strain DSM 15567 / CIP 107919 / 50-1 BON) TaxID=697281 RepID=F3ZWS3_MAHA5|nr:hypothetical protein [Mahella australiensis]AEE96516.1 hypothetical protein Mahau_1322 [Mahella australiensis 50-1 BON]